MNFGVAVLRRLGVKGVEIRKPEQLRSVRALIIPGGESTTMAKLAEYHNLVCLLSLSLSLQEESTVIGIDVKLRSCVFLNVEKRGLTFMSVYICAF